MESSAVSWALTATRSVACGLGLKVEDIIVIQNSNRLAIHLAPCDVLARVVASSHRDREVAAFEIEIARHFEEADSPMAVLDPRVEPVVYSRDGFEITLWKYYEPLPGGEIAPADYGQALGRLHSSMRRLDVVAPHFTDRVDEAQAIVQDESQSPGLADADRELLSNSLSSLRGAVVARSKNEQLIHGEPHPGNVLATGSGIRFVDLQTCCYGPVEFDIAHAPDEVGEHYATADPVQLRDCRILTLALVAAWRADRYDHFPNGREMRESLLATIRQAVDGAGIDGHH